VDGGSADAKYSERVFGQAAQAAFRVYAALAARYNGGMRFRVGLVAGFAIGYYLGAKAGRERFEQIQRWLDDAKQSRPVEKAQAAVELGLERIRQQTEAVTGASPNGPGASS
jgi:hypothetical protein